MQTYPIETYDQWNARLAANRRNRIAAETDPKRWAELQAVDARCQADNALIDAIFGEPAPAKRYIGCWSEIGNSEYAGFAVGTYATEGEAIAAAEKCAGKYRSCQVWACEAKEAVC